MKTIKNVKNKFTAAIAASAVLCSGTFLFACDGNTQTPDPTPTPPPVPETPLTASEKLGKGLTNLFDANGLSGSVAFSFDANGEKTDYDYSYTKSGNRVEATDGEDKYIVDLNTGYYYEVRGETATAEQIIDAGRYGYIVEAVKTELSDEAEEYDIDEYVTLGDDGSVRYSADYKSKVNAALKPVIDYYEDGTLYELIDALLAERGKKLSNELNVIEYYVIAAQNSSATLAVNSIDTYLVNYNTSVKQIFMSFGITEEQYKAVSERTVGEMAEGVIALYNEMEGSIADFMNGGTIDMTAEQIALKVFDTVFVDEVDTSNLAGDVIEFKEAVSDWLQITKVKTVVNQIVKATGNDDIAVAIEQRVSFTALRFEMTVEFDGNGNISAVDYSALTEYNYAVDGTPTTYSYSATGRITVSYDETPSVTLPIGAAVKELALKVFASASDTVAYIETGGNKGALEIISCAADGEEVSVNADGVVFDAEESTITFDKSIADSVRDSERNVEVEIIGTLGGAPIRIIYTVPADYTLESLLGK